MAGWQADLGLSALVCFQSKSRWPATAALSVSFCLFCSSAQVGPERGLWEAELMSEGGVHRRAACGVSWRGFRCCLRESKFSCLCLSAVPFKIRLLELFVVVTVWRLKRCLRTELPHSSSQITGLQTGSHQETKGIVLFLEPRQRIVKVSVKHCLKQSS